MTMCPKHRQQYHGWLNYNPGPISGWLQTSEDNHQNAVTRSLENYKSRAEERRLLIRNQVTAIAELCRDGRGCSDETKEAN